MKTKLNKSITNHVKWNQNVHARYKNISYTTRIMLYVIGMDNCMYVKLNTTYIHILYKCVDVIYTVMTACLGWKTVSRSETLLKLNSLSQLNNQDMVVWSDSRMYGTLHKHSLLMTRVW